MEKVKFSSENIVVNYEAVLRIVLKADIVGLSMKNSNIKQPKFLFLNNFYLLD